MERDGYCNDCRTVGCQRGSESERVSMTQMDRLELKLNKIIRHLGLDVEGDPDDH